MTAELNDEKIDIVDYSEDIAQFVANALSPAKVSAAFIVNERFGVNLLGYPIGDNQHRF